MKLLLHLCCGPCACYPVKKLRAGGIEPVGYFFNPNIHPYKEWERRLKTAQEFAAKVDLEFYADANYRLRDWLVRALAAPKADSVLQPPPRCRVCYAWRLDEAARFAAENDFDAFSSTLFYSIYQQHEVMKEIAASCADKYGIKFYYEDFRPGWQAGIDISLEMGLYRQPYCGCIFSEEERYSRAIKKARKKAGRALKAARQSAENKKRLS